MPQAPEIGDQSGKFEVFQKWTPCSDVFPTLYGVNSIVGRSIVIHFVNTSSLRNQVNTKNMKVHRGNTGNTGNIGSA